jgi:hypothetical protein
MKIIEILESRKEALRVSEAARILGVSHHVNRLNTPAQFDPDWLP